MLTYIPLKSPEGQVVGRVALRDTQAKLMLSESLMGKTYLFCGGEFLELRCDRELQLKKAPGGGKASVVTVDGRRLCCWGSNEGRSAAELMFCLSQFCRMEDAKEVKEEHAEPPEPEPVQEEAREDRTEFSEPELEPVEPEPEPVEPELVEPELVEEALPNSVEQSRSRTETFVALARRVDAVFDRIDRVHEPSIAHIETAKPPETLSAAHRSWFAQVDELTRRR